MPRSSRRGALLAIANTSTFFPILGQKTQGQGPQQVNVFTQQELDLLTTLTECIIPKTDTPGAAEAGVPAIIQDNAARNPQRLKAWQAALKWFAANGAAASLERISKESKTEGATHFALLKGETIDAYYSTQAGLRTELGWNGNTYLADFPGCTHPEHQA